MKNVTIILITIISFSIPAFSQERNTSTPVERLRDSFRKNVREMLDTESVQNGYDKKGLKLTKMALDRSISDKKIQDRSIAYYKEIYVDNIRSKYEKNGQVGVKKLIAKELETDDLFHIILLLRGEIQPLITYEKLTDSMIEAARFKSFISAIVPEEAKKTYFEEAWKSVWYAPDHLTYHLKRVLRRDRKQNAEMNFLIHQKEPSYSRFQMVSLPAENGVPTFADLIELKQHYGERKKFQHFVFNYPLYSFSRFQSAELSGALETKELVDLYITYGNKLIKDKQKRDTFWKRVAGRLNAEAEEELRHRISD